MIPIAVGDNVIGKEIAESKVTEGGIIMPETVQKQLPQKNCEIISVGELVTADIQPGDLAVCHTQAGQAMFYDNQIYLVLKAPEIYGILNRKSKGKKELLTEKFGKGEVF
jgi:co-chaperonin GroES (HSP10)